MAAFQRLLWMESGQKLRMLKAMTTNWDEIGSLHHVKGDYLVREAPLRLLVTTAVQGHEGAPEELLITTANGTTLRGDAIRELAARPDRRRL